MSVILELGPGETFLFDTPGGTTTNHLPEGLKDLGAGIGEGRPIQAIYSLNFGSNGAYVLAARNVHSAIIRRHNLPAQLESWLIDPVTHTCKRDIPTLSVEFGPNGSFYARDKDSYRWHNLPDALEEAIQQRLCPAGWMARPDYVVLGLDGAFIYSNDCGGCSHALGNYPKLQEFVLGVQRSNLGGLTGFALVQWVSMSIFRPGHFIALHNTGQYVAELSPDATHALNSMASTLPARNLTLQQAPRAVSQPIMHQPSSPPMYSPTSPPPTQTTLPIRKPVGTVATQPHNPHRPQAPHLVSSPIPHAQQPRPAVHPQASAPAVPQVQSTIRPVSMQVPPPAQRANAGNRTSMNIKNFGQVLKNTTNRFSNAQQHHQQQQQNNQNTYTYSNYGNPNANTSNNSSTTYVVAGDSGTTSSSSYIIDPTTSTTTIDNTSTTIYDTSSPTDTNDTTYTTIVDDNNTTTTANYDTTTGTYISPTSPSIGDTSYINSTTYTTTSVDSNTGVMDTTSSTFVTADDGTGTYDAVDTTTDTTSVVDTTDVVSGGGGDSGGIFSSIVSSSGGDSGGDSGGFWSGLMS